MAKNRSEDYKINKNIFDSGFDEYLKREGIDSEAIDPWRLSAFKSAVLNTLDSTDNSIDTSKSKTLLIVDPADTDNFTFFPLPTNKAITLTTIRVVIQGSASPSVTWSIRHGEQRNGSGTLILSDTTTSEGNGDTYVANDLNVTTIPANHWVWYESSAVANINDGDNLNIGLFYT